MSHLPSNQADLANRQEVQHQAEAFHKALPMYRIAMSMCANAITDLNTAGSSRLASMKWWTNRDDGLAQPKEFADVISRVHRAALSLDPELAGKLGDITVLSMEGGRRAKVADMVDAQNTLELLHEAAGIHLSPDGQHIVANSGEARVCRSRCMFSVLSACQGVSNGVRQFLDQRDMAPASQPATPERRNDQPSLPSFRSPSL